MEAFSLLLYVLDGPQAEVQRRGLQCAEHFARVCGMLDEVGVAYRVDPRIVRGLDYYTRTVFEFVSSELGAQATGIAKFSWNGAESNGKQAPAGVYSLAATVAGVPAGTTISTYVNGTVQSVTMGSGTTGMSLDVAGVGDVPFANVEQISN